MTNESCVLVSRTHDNQYETGDVTCVNQGCSQNQKMQLKKMDLWVRITSLERKRKQKLLEQLGTEGLWKPHLTRNTIQGLEDEVFHWLQKEEKVASELLKTLDEAITKLKVSCNDGSCSPCATWKLSSHRPTPCQSLILVVIASFSFVSCLRDTLRSVTAEHIVVCNCFLLDTSRTGTR